MLSSAYRHVLVNTITGKWYTSKRHGGWTHLKSSLFIVFEILKLQVNSAQVCVWLTLKHFLMIALICLINDLITVSGNVGCTLLIIVGHQAGQILLVNQGAVTWRRLQQGRRRTCNYQIHTHALWHDSHLQCKANLASSSTCEENFNG